MENPVDICLLKSHSNFDHIPVYQFLCLSVSLSPSFPFSGCLPLSLFVFPAAGEKLLSPLPRPFYTVPFRARHWTPKGVSCGSCEVIKVAEYET